MTGPPGAGKSTVARAVTRTFERSAVVAGDDFFACIDRGFIAPWTAEAHRQNEVVLTAAAAAAGRLAMGGYTVVYDGVVGPWFLDCFGTASGLSRLHYVVLLPPEDTCVGRVRSRANHGFTDLEATRLLFGQFADAGLDERHLLKARSLPSASPPPSWISCGRDPFNGSVRPPARGIAGPVQRGRRPSHVSRHR